MIQRVGICRAAMVRPVAGVWSRPFIPLEPEVLPDITGGLTGPCQRSDPVEVGHVKSSRIQCVFDIVRGRAIPIRPPGSDILLARECAEILKCIYVLRQR